MSVFETLNKVNVNDHTEKKGKLTYLSWAWAWAEVKKRYPEATYTIYETPEGMNYFADGRTCWVKTGVTIEGLEHIDVHGVHEALAGIARHPIELRVDTPGDVPQIVSAIEAVPIEVFRDGLLVHVHVLEVVAMAAPRPLRHHLVVDLVNPVVAIDLYRLFADHGAHQLPVYIDEITSNTS